ATIVAAAIAPSIRSLRGYSARSRQHAEAVAKEVDAAPGDLLDCPEAREEARPPFASNDLEAPSAQQRPERAGVPEADVGRILGEQDLVRLQPLDEMTRVRRVQRERPG